MKWQITSGELKTSVAIPDRVVDGEEFDLSVNGVAYRGRWARSLGTLFLRRRLKTQLIPGAARQEEPVEAAYRLRSAAVNRFGGESAVGISLEYSAATKFRTQTLVAQAELDVPAQAQRSKSLAQGAALVRSPMSGKVLEVLVQGGSSVKKGEAVVIIEAMKMENRIVAPQPGLVTKLNAKAGDSVNTGDALFEVEAPAKA